MNPLSIEVAHGLHQAVALHDFQLIDVIRKIFIEVYRTDLFINYFITAQTYIENVPIYPLNFRLTYDIYLAVNCCCICSFGFENIWNGTFKWTKLNAL